MLRVYSVPNLNFSSIKTPHSHRNKNNLKTVEAKVAKELGHDNESIQNSSLCMLPLEEYLRTVEKKIRSKLQ